MWHALAVLTLTAIFVLSFLFWASVWSAVGALADAGGQAVALLKDASPRRVREGAARAGQTTAAAPTAVEQVRSASDAAREHVAEEVRGASEGVASAWEATRESATRSLQEAVNDAVQDLGTETLRRATDTVEDIAAEQARRASERLDDLTARINSPARIDPPARAPTSTPAPEPAPTATVAPTPRATPELSARSAESGRAPWVLLPQPAPGSRVAAGAIVVEARGRGDAPITQIRLLLDGAPLSVTLEQRSETVWRGQAQASVAPGEHVVVATIVDAEGRTGSYRWTFTADN